MLDRLIDSPLLLASAIAALCVLNYALGLSVVRAYARQHSLERDELRPPGIAGRAQANASRLALPFAAATVVIAATLLMDRFGREIIGGGFFVMQVPTLGSNVADLLAMRSLRRPDAVEGRLRYSAGYQYRAAAARLVGASIVAGVVAFLFRSPPFLAGAVLLLATAGGWYRRARQADRRSLIPDP